MTTTKRRLIITSIGLLLFLIACLVAAGYYANSVSYQARLFVRSRDCTPKFTRWDRFLVGAGHVVKRVSSSEAGDPVLVPEVCRIARTDPDPNIRCQAIYGLTWFDDDKSCEPAVIETWIDRLLHDDDYYVREHAAMYMANSRSVAARMILSALRQDDDPRLRDMAARAAQERVERDHHKAADTAPADNMKL